MPNWVPQSPTWFCRITRWPSASRIAGDRIADDGAAQVPDVHLLGQVRARIVDHHGSGFDSGFDQGSVDLEVVGEKGIVQADVQEAGTGDFDGLGHVFRFQGGEYPFGQRARIRPVALCGRHDAIGLVVAEFGFRGGVHERGCGGSASSQCLPDPR